MTSSSAEDDYYGDQSESFGYSHWTYDNIYGLDLKSAPDEVASEFYQRFLSVVFSSSLDINMIIV